MTAFDNEHSTRFKLLLNFTWWVNRKDRFGKNVFEGGFLGLDNIGIFGSTDWTGCVAKLIPLFGILVAKGALEGGKAAAFKKGSGG